MSRRAVNLGLLPILLLILFKFGHQFVAGRELAFLQCVWRHGDRAPGGLPYPGDQNDESRWPRGWSQLTNLGMRQMQEVGQFLRHRYIKEMHFLGESFNPDELYIQSSDSARALESAQALLHGMFPALDQFSGGWQPIAVHSTGPNNELLKPTSFDCPIYDKLKKTVKRALEQDMTHRYPDLFEFLRTNVYNSTEPISLRQAAKLNNLNREVIHNMSQPDWVQQRRWPQYGNLTTLQLVTELRRQERINEFKRPELAYLKGGFLLGDWLRRAQQLVKGKSPEDADKAVFYSAHDGTLQALLYAMGVGDDELVPYAALVCMEIYKRKEEADAEKGEEAGNGGGPYQIELLYRHSGQMEQLELPNCPVSSCSAEEALKMLKNMAIFSKQKLFEECGKQDFCEMPAAAAAAGTNRDIAAAGLGSLLMLFSAFFVLTL